jgi:hydroxylaminobenzene mutase
VLARQGHRLLQLGVALLLFTSLEGFAVEYVASPHLARSVHTLAALSGVLVLAFGLVWTRLELGAAQARTAFWCLVYSVLAIIAAFALAALWGAGNATMPIAAGAAHGSAFQETVIAAVAYSSAPTGIVAFALSLWGLRKMPSQPMAGTGPDELQ